MWYVYPSFTFSAWKPNFLTKQLRAITGRHTCATTNKRHIFPYNTHAPRCAPEWHWRALHVCFVENAISFVERVSYHSTPKLLIHNHFMMPITLWMRLVPIIIYIIIIFIIYIRNHNNTYIINHLYHSFWYAERGIMNELPLPWLLLRCLFDQCLNLSTFNPNSMLFSTLIPFFLRCIAFIALLLYSSI